MLITKKYTYANTLHEMSCFLKCPPMLCCTGWEGEGDVEALGRAAAQLPCRRERSRVSYPITLFPGGADSRSGTKIIRIPKHLETKAICTVNTSENHIVIEYLIYLQRIISSPSCLLKTCLCYKRTNYPVSQDTTDAIFFPCTLICQHTSIS